MPPRRQSNIGRKRKSEQLTAAPEPAAPPRIRYFDKDAISEHLVCPICQEIFNYPIALLCGHVFCDGCIREWLKQQRNCPECRQSADMRNSHKDLIAHKFLDSVPVYCSYLGCSWIGRMDALQGHMSECDCNPEILPDFMITKESPNQSRIPGSEDGPPDRGTTSLRMKLFKGSNRDLLSTVASGENNIFSSSSKDTTNQQAIGLNDLTSDLVRSVDIINRNKPKINPPTDFIDLSDDD